MENHEYGQITATSSPYLWSLGQRYALLTDYFAVGHNSEMNYVSFAAGQHAGVTDGTTRITFPSIWDQLQRAGRSWHAYEQGIPSGCFTGASSAASVTDGVGLAGQYVERHDPAMVFADVAAGGCAGRISALASFVPTSARLIFVTPNLCNDEHNACPPQSSLLNGDGFLRAFVPKILASPDFARTLLVITYDEGTTSAGQLPGDDGGHVFTVGVAPWLSHRIIATDADHYSLLHTVEVADGLPCLATACQRSPVSQLLP